MSLAIDIDNVTAVLLADGWHSVLNTSFKLDAYEYLEGDFLLQGGGQYGICAQGFEFETATLGQEGWEPSYTIAGPLTAILAVRHKR